MIVFPWATILSLSPPMRLETLSQDATGKVDPPRTLIEAAYRRLRRDIIDGVQPAGKKLRVEHLKSEYEVSAGTLREALALLVADSLVVSREQRGFQVAPMSLTDLEDLTRIRVLLECEAVEESIHLGQDDWEANLVGAFHRLSRAEERLCADAAGTFDEWEDCNRQFHEALVGACTSTWLRKLRALLYQQAERYRRLSAIKGPRPVGVHEEHREIFDAVMARDTSKAKALIRDHIQRALTVIRMTDILK
ncbi:GntR family transcriptional regulator [Burkholderia vietnamiensis]|uniref:GntR family transcriptional regulator n=1 Tax=Burkholderia vietnamiensis TaxID=60552 RepID=UPI0026500453|nr:FCD domain-containing protein [Burkholderia vietnamiensis]MDN8071214.1 FCD domain-containing protein [Burkholderia vietnamiensis]